MKAGDYFKLVGDYAGVVWTGRRWERFDCQRCVILAGIAKGAPLQGPLSKGAAAALRMPVVHRHDPVRHGEWLRARSARLSDDGAGGTFTPASVKLSATSPAATFTYTPKRPEKPA